MKFKKIKGYNVNIGYTDIDKKYCIYDEDEDGWSVYRRKTCNVLEFVGYFKTLKEAKKFVESDARNDKEYMGEYDEDGEHPIVEW